MLWMFYLQFAQHGGVQAIKEAILNTEDITLQVQPA